MQFIKMHGIGNDYVFVNGFRESVEDPAILAPAIADRHTGVGGDGLILVLPPSDQAAAGGDRVDARMRMFNADGSEAEMCGNGIRCVCKLVHDHGLMAGRDAAGDRSRSMRIETGAGVLNLDYTTDDRGKVEQVTVDMGAPILEPGSIGVELAGLDCIVDHPTDQLIEWPGCPDQSWLQTSGLDQQMTCVSMGNPHVILYCRDVARVPLHAVGPKLEHHSLFPNRINVHFVQVHTQEEVTMRTWERGSGPTQACGTGAAAVCVAGVLTNRTGRSITAHLPGGDLALDWRKSDNHVYMTGPAAESFTGTWPG